MSIASLVQSDADCTIGFAVDQSMGKHIPCPRFIFLTVCIMKESGDPVKAQKRYKSRNLLVRVQNLPKVRAMFMTGV